MTFNIKTIFKNRIALNNDEGGQLYDHSIIEEYQAVDSVQALNVVCMVLDINPNEPKPTFSYNVEMPEEVKQKIENEYVIRFEKFNLIRNEFDEFVNSDEIEKSYSVQFDYDQNNSTDNNVIEDIIIISKNK